MKGIYEGGLQPAGMNITDHLEQTSDQQGFTPNCGPECMDPKKGGMADPTSGASFQKTFVEQSGYTTAGDMDVRSGQDRTPSEVTWNGMK